LEQETYDPHDDVEMENMVLPPFFTYELVTLETLDFEEIHSVGQSGQMARE
jgi:hypothetical protein